MCRFIDLLIIAVDRWQQCARCCMLLDKHRLILCICIRRLPGGSFRIFIRSFHKIRGRFFRLVSDGGGKEKNQKRSFACVATTPTGDIAREGSGDGELWLATETDDCDDEDMASQTLIFMALAHNFTVLLQLLCIICVLLCLLLGIMVRARGRANSTD